MTIWASDPAKFKHLEFIPADWREWDVKVANQSTLADTFARESDRALLFRTLATLRTDIVLFDDVEELRWNGPTGPPQAWLDPALTRVGESAGW